MTFLHSEFFLWMLLPTGVLFYFWQTQKPYANRWLSEAVLQKLRAPEMTMGLQGRNTLFLIAAVLLISAMAQPVLLEPFEQENTKANILFAIQTGTGSDADLKSTKKVVLEAMGAVAGNNMAVVAFDEGVYRVVPLSDDYPIVSGLVRNLPRTGSTSNPSKMFSAIETMEEMDTVVVAAAEGMAIESDRVVVLHDSGDIGTLVERIEKHKEAQRLAAHIPLFYYPLGLAMILIWIALSSMSRRRSVPVAALIAMTWIVQPPVAEAKFFDFGLLHEAEEAYENGEYAKSAALFERYQQSHDSAQVRYNRANALYKAGRYKQAEFWYRHVYTNNPQLEKRKKYNLAQVRKQMALLGEKDDTDNVTEGQGKEEKNRLEKVAAKKASGFTTRLYTIP